MKTNAPKAVRDVLVDQRRRLNARLAEIRSDVEDYEAHLAASRRHERRLAEKIHELDEFLEGEG